MPQSPDSRVGERSEPLAETNRPGLAWSRTVIGVTPGDRESLPPLVPLQPSWSKGWGPYSGFESFPLCYTTGRHEGARREEFMTESADRAVLLLQKVSELLLESRAIAQQLEVAPDGESSADTADRIAYGILVAALEEGLVNTIRHALDVLKRFSAPAGILGDQWLREQEGRLGKREKSSLWSDDLVIWPSQ